MHPRSEIEIYEYPVRYRPVPVRKSLETIRDLTELMVDLAYSAVLFEANDLAEEVIELEMEVDRQRLLLLMNAALAARSKEDAEQMAGIMSASAAMDKISDAAADIAKVQLRIQVHPAVRRALQEVEERLARVVIGTASSLRHKSLGQVNLPRAVGVDVIAIRRKHKLMVNPGPRVQFQEGDAVIVRGSSPRIQSFMQMAEGAQQAG